MKKLIAFLLCFTVLAVGVTYGCIQYTLRAPAEEEAIVEQGIDLNGFYDENDLRVIEIRQDTDDTYNSYPQFEGLKNTEVQTAINDLIRSEAERLMQQDVDALGDVKFLSYNVSGSFANTLSVGLYSAHEQVYLNFNLNDGSQLQLTDLFAADADLQGMVHGAFYDAVTRANLGNNYTEDVNYPDENELYKTVKGYLESGNKQFLFTPGEIFLYYDNYAASIPMIEYAEDIVIYSKYLTEESLFAEDGIGYDGVFTCARLQSGFDEREFGFAAENFWYDVALMERYVDDSLPADVQEQFLGFYDDVYAGLRAEVDVILAEAKANPDQAYIYMACPFVHLCTDSEYVGDSWSVTPSVAAEVTLNYRLYTMSAELFETKYLPVLREEYRSNNYYLFYGGIDEGIDNDVQLDKRQSAQLYNYETGQLLTIDDVFAEGYDHAAAVRANAKYDLMSYYGYTMEAAELAVQGVWYELDGVGLRVYIPEWGTEQYLTMSLSDFPDHGLAIYK